jgi:hypothetical protein
MTSTAVRMLCRLLIVALFALPFQPAMAGMISTDQTLAASAGQADRDVILNALSRRDVADELQSQGVGPEAAKARVAALTDSEARQLAGQINSAPAGASHAAWWIAGVVVVALAILYFYNYK